MSSFGISGTNAHVILEEAPEVSVEVVEAPSGPVPVPVVVSGASAAALRGQAERLAAWLSSGSGLSHR
ncbi:ketoacyl-synthetase C-terminal extension domain-containing protein, partial [Streptomyces sp. NRRL S-646]|uniref:ketoacyl-synthetase C-terminal extension domain-containing protein n=1 Tax=Streptomyces sp. NRRL S-646 TaxID=1463917 RepID=UPI0005653DC8